MYSRFLSKFFELSIIFHTQFTSTTLPLAEATTTTHDSKKNKFEAGCLQYVHKPKERPHDDVKLDLFERRVCNSDDALVGNIENCRAPTFENYKEVRIGAGNWDECKSSILLIFYLCKVVIDVVIADHLSIFLMCPRRKQRLSFHGFIKLFCLKCSVSPQQLMVISR